MNYFEKVNNKTEEVIYFISSGHQEVEPKIWSLCSVQLCDTFV